MRIFVQDWLVFQLGKYFSFYTIFTVCYLNNKKKEAKMSRLGCNYYCIAGTVTKDSSKYHLIHGVPLIDDVTQGRENRGRGKYGK